MVPPHTPPPSAFVTVQESFDSLKSPGSEEPGDSYVLTKNCFCGTSRATPMAYPFLPHQRTHWSTDLPPAKPHQNAPPQLQSRRPNGLPTTAAPKNELVRRPAARKALPKRPSAAAVEKAQWPARHRRTEERIVRGDSPLIWCRRCGRRRRPDRGRCRRAR